MQIKTTIKCHLIQTKMATLKIMNITNIGKDVEKLEPSYIASGNGKMV